MFKKYFSLLVLASLLTSLIGISIYIIGCGQGAVVSDEPPPAFYIVNRSPTIGATDVAPTENIVITFSNPLLIKEVLTLVATLQSHTAGNPSTIEVVWSNYYKTATLSIEGWDNPNGRVHIFAGTNILDIHGQVLPLGTPISNYGLVGAPPAYNIKGTVDGGTAGKWVFVLAVTTTEGLAEDTTFGIDIGTANPFSYFITGLPPGWYYVGAFRDENNNGLENAGEVGDFGNIYPTFTSPSSIEVPPSTSEVDFTLMLIEE